MKITRLAALCLAALMAAVKVHGISHITGGGYYENIPRMMKDGLTARIEKSKIPVHPISSRRR